MPATSVISSIILWRRDVDHVHEAFIAGIHDFGNESEQESVPKLNLSCLLKAERVNSDVESTTVGNINHTARRGVDEMYRD